MEFIRAQRTKIPQILPTNLSNKTILITGGNAGLGLEAAREVLPHRPGRLILAVRNLDKGNAAREQLDKVKEASTTIETHQLDQSCFKSVYDFVKGLKGERVDYALLNAGRRSGLLFQQCYRLLTSYTIKRRLEFKIYCNH